MHALIAFCFIAAFAACYVIPYRLGLGSEGSYFTFGYVGDEYTYAERLQPLIAGTTASNPVNGVCDPHVVSQYFLEDLARAAVTVSGMHVITFVWVWRIVFCILLALLIAGLSLAVVQRRRAGMWTLRLAASAAAFSLLYCMYDLVTAFPPLQGWLNRFPTNVEFLLSVALAWSFLRFVSAPQIRQGVILALVSVGAVYLRPYVVLPWAPVVAGGTIYLLLARRLEMRVAIATLATLLVALAPWIGIAYWNNGLEVHQQMMKRYMLIPLAAYRVHPRWMVLLGSAALLSLSAWKLPAQRILLAGGAAILVVLTFVSGLFGFSREIVLYDRYGTFYLVLILIAGLGLISKLSMRWRGRDGLQSARAAATALCAASLLCSASLGWRNWNYDLEKYPFGPLPAVRQDLKFLKCYEWVRDHTPADALFVVDDGVDWSAENRARNGRAVGDKFMFMQNDLFQLVAQRRKVHSLRLYGNALSDSDLALLWTVQFGIIGTQDDSELPGLWLFHYGTGRNPCALATALQRFPPDYIFWRTGLKDSRGRREQLRAEAEIVYSDENCEIWRLKKK